MFNFQQPIVVDHEVEEVDFQNTNVRTTNPVTAAANVNGFGSSNFNMKREGGRGRGRGGRAGGRGNHAAAASSPVPLNASVPPFIPSDNTLMTTSTTTATLTNSKFKVVFSKKSDIGSSSSGGAVGSSTTSSLSSHEQLQQQQRQTSFSPSFPASGGGGSGGMRQQQQPQSYNNGNKNSTPAKRYNNNNGSQSPQNSNSFTSPRSRGGGQLYSPRGGGNRGGSTPRRDRNTPFYDEHWDEKLVEDLLDKGEVFKGIIRINKRNNQDAYVTVKGMQDDIYIAGSKNRNRALEGDVVVVALLKGDELKIEQDRRNDKKDQRKLDDLDRLKKCQLPGHVVTEESLMLDDIDNDADTPLAESELRELVFGKVVRLINQKREHDFVGMLIPTLSKNEQDIERAVKNLKTYRNIWFRPSDKRVPLIAIPTEYVAKEYLEDPSLLNTTLFRAAITSWAVNSNYPDGILNGTIGQMGEIPIETTALLIDNGVHWTEKFSDQVMRCLPATPWAIPASEFAKRIDFRSLDIFTIDPLTAKDLDDALHIRQISDHHFEVGVHIADVSFFVHPNCALDMEAQNRSTTVYLVQRAIPMLPRLLCEELCSLNPGVDRLAFSVVWKLDLFGNIVGKPWFGRSVIRSRGKLSYDHAQAYIDGHKSWDDARAAGASLKHIDLSDGVKEETVRNSVLRLYELSLHTRKRRFDNGALSINNVKLWFSLDQDCNPNGCGPYIIKEANRLIEEFMLMANISVSHEISKRYPEIALLRRHQAPVERALNEFANYAKALGFTQFEGVAESSNKLQAAFDSIEDPLKRDVMMALCVKPLKRAQYYCSGDETVTVSEMGHYALSVPLYTHFTSPIRRYCDLIVHRLLDGACKRVASNSSANIPLLQTLGKYRIKPNVSLVDELVDQKKTGGDGNDAIHSSIEDVVEEEDEMDRLYNVERVMEIAANCNMRKDSSKNAQDSSQRLFLCAHLTRQASLNPNAEFIEEGIVCKVANRSFDVLIPNCGMDKRCWVEDLVEKDLVFGCEFNELKSILTIHWKPLGGAGSDGGVGGKGGNSLLQQMGSLSLSNNNDSTSDVGSGSGVVQQIQVFEKVKVSLVVQFARSPPEIKIIAVHPLYKGRVGSSEALYTEESSCPAIADDDS